MSLDFNKISIAVGKQFQKMTKSGQLFRVTLDKNTLWDTYLQSFPVGTNPIYKERTEHDCQCCKSFIRTIGGVIAIIDGKVETLWDFTVDDPAYQAVADAMALLVKTSPIDNIFLHTEKTVGVAKTFDLNTGSPVTTWEHFHLTLPTECVVKGINIGPKLSDVRSTKDVMLRSLTELTLDSVDTVLELIGQNSLYRGEEQKFAVQEFRNLKAKTDKMITMQDKELFVWSNYHTIPASVSRIRNTAIGTLIQDLSEDKDLEYAVKSFETKVAPTNYKRPTALVTKAMVQKAQADIAELGYTSALERRYATIDDITINNILFADRTAKKAMNVFDEIAAAVPEKTKNFDKVEEVTIEKFLVDILPKAESVEVLFENKHAGNLVSLIAPVDPTAKSMFKWDNNFSWSYTGEVADSIKERVKKAGGKVDGDFRASLSWFNYDDLDLHLHEPGGMHIYFGNKMSSSTKGQLDVDMNAGGGRSRTPVENIFYPNRVNMREGTYRLDVHNFCRRETKDIGFDVEMEFDGTIYSFAYDKAVKDKDTITVAEFTYSHKVGLKLVKSLPSSQVSKNMWATTTETFHKVNVVMLSPNHWDGHPVGNKHYFFMLENCTNEGQARGFFNEFLNDSLSAHRKVFEMVGAKMRTEESDRQLSGLGFSSTQRNSLLCRVKGNFSRTVKITF